MKTAKARTKSTGRRTSAASKAKSGSAHSAAKPAHAGASGTGTAGTIFVILACVLLVLSIGQAFQIQKLEQKITVQANGNSAGGLPSPTRAGSLPAAPAPTMVGGC